MRTSRTRAVLAVGGALIAIGLLAAACSPSETSSDDGTTGTSVITNVSVPSSEQPKTGGKLVYGIEADSDGFNPTANRWAISGTLVANAIFDPLTAYDADGVAQPYLLATQEHNEDYTVWTGTLREGITWHDGTPVTAADLVRHTEALKASPLTGPAASVVESAKAVDDRTMEVTMRQPWVAFPAILTGQAGYLAKLDAPDPSKSPIGTGPFVFVSYSQGSKIEVKRNDNYWRKDSSGNQLPYLDQVEFRPLPDVQARAAALESGDVNAIHINSEVQLRRLQQRASQGDIQLIFDEGPQEKNFFMINTAKPPLDDVRLRKALAMGTDVDSLITIAEADPTKKIDSVFSKESPWYVDPGWPGYKPEEAQALVNEVVAEKGPISITLGTAPNPDSQKITQATAEMWRALGIDVQERDFEQVTFILNVVQGDYDVVLWRQFGEVEPDSGYHWWISENAQPIGTLALNMARNKDEQIDAALNEGRSNPDPAARKEAYGELQQRFTDLVPYIWTWETTWAIATDNDVRDITNGPLPDGQPSLPLQNGSHRLTQTWIAT